DEDRSVTVAGDDVELTPSAPEVAFENEQTGVFEERGGEVLSPAAECLLAQAFGGPGALPRACLTRCSCPTGCPCPSHVAQMTMTAWQRGRAEKRPVEEACPSTGR